MDVTCNRCGTSYEFEEGLVSATGTTVKCTQCGHLFKVHRTAAPPATTTQRDTEPDTSADETLKWRVRRTDGSIHSLESLSELTRLIGAGQFHRDDEISRTGQLWRKLGQISELASLFEPVARVRRLSQPPPAPTLVEEPDLDAGDLVDTQTASIMSDATTTQRIQPQPAPPTRFEVMGSEVEVGAPAPRKQEGEVQSGEARPQTARPPSSRPLSPRSEPAAAVAKPTQEPNAKADGLDRPRRGLSWPIAVTVPLLIAAGVAGALLLRAPLAAPPKAQPARELVKNGDQALASHRFERFDEAISEYSKALAYAKDDPHILSSISRVYAVWAEALRTRLESAPEKSGRSDSESESLRSEEHRLAAQGKFYGERAAQRNPGNEEASVALSDALRLGGNLVGARAELDRARSTEGVPEAETLRVAALLARDEAHGDVAAARKLAERAVAQDPSMIRARLLLAQCMIAEHDFEGARLHLDAVRAQDASNPTLLEADAQLDHARQAKPSTSPSARPPEHPSTPPSAPSAVGAKETDAARAAKLDPMELVHHGEAALERGAVRTAEHDFEQALSLSPHLARAETGLGYVALERSEPSAAISHFKPAASAGHAEALIGLGDAYRRLGRTRAALEAYQKYLKQFPGGSRTSIAQRQIELLQEQVQQAGP